MWWEYQALSLRTRGGRRWLAKGAGLLLVGACTAFTASAAPAREHDIKAVFLFRFLQLVEWPTQSFANAKSPIVVGILGADPFGDSLDGAIRYEEIDGRNVVIRRGATLAEILPCHLLFVPNAAGEWSPPGLPGGQREGMLLVGESPGFLDIGGMINFYIQDNQVRFEICPEAAEAVGIRIRSRLLHLARIVGCRVTAPARMRPADWR